ncbi:MAG: AraC family ligand binding domain-containing protein [Eisenbergiella sp.]
MLLKAYEFTIDKPLEYVCTGKFEALSPNWIHETADLTDYELFVISKGPLYISYQNQDYTVNTGETLLLPPGQPPLTCAAASSLPTAAFTGCILSPLIRSPCNSGRRFPGNARLSDGK